MNKGMSRINGEIYVTGELFSPTTAGLSKGVIYSGGYKQSPENDKNEFHHTSNTETLSVDCMSPHRYDVPSALTYSTHRVTHKTSSRHFFGDKMKLNFKKFFSKVDLACSQGLQIGERALNDCRIEVLSSPIHTEQKCPICSSLLTTQVFRKDNGCAQKTRLYPLPPFCSYCRTYNLFEHPLIDDKGSLENLTDLMTDANQSRFRKGKIIFHNTFEEPHLRRMINEDEISIQEKCSHLFPHDKVNRNFGMSVEKLQKELRNEGNDKNEEKYKYLSSMDEVSEKLTRPKCSQECEKEPPIFEVTTIDETIKTEISSESSFSSSPTLNKVERRSINGKKDKKVLDEMDSNDIVECNFSELSLNDEEFNREIILQKPCLESIFPSGEREDSDEMSINSSRKELEVKKEIFAM